MQMEARSSLYFTSGSLRTPVASRRCLHRNKAFIIETTKKPRWQLNFSKSSSSLIFCSNRNLSNKSLQVDQRAWYLHAKCWSPHHHAYWQFFIKYEPWNIHLEYFEPNLTSFIQPCDAGIIHCVKAHYHHAYCLQVIELDKANECDIYKINLLEAMLMVKDAWDTVTAETITHCWNHTGILPPITTTGPQIATTAMEPVLKHTPMKAGKGWDIIQEFAVSSSMTLPQAKERLKSIFRVDYINQDWCPALNAVLEAENDELKALQAIKKLTLANNPISTTNSTKPATLASGCWKGPHQCGGWAKGPKAHHWDPINLGGNAGSSQRARNQGFHV